MRIKIKNDLFDVVDRIKAIDKRYEVFFDTNLQKFVLEAEGKTQIVFPYENLDERAVRRTLFTRVSNAEEVLETVDKNNARMEREREKRISDIIDDEVSRELRLRGI